MRSHGWLIGFLAAALLVGACGNSEGDGNGDRVYSAEEVGDVMLVADDAGDGWSEQAREVFTARGDEDPPAFDPTSFCPAASDETDKMAELAADSGAIVELQLREPGQRNFHGVSEQLWSGTGANDYFAAVNRAFEACDGTTWKAEGDESEEDADITLESLEPPSVGDESTAVVAEVVTPGPDGDYVWRSRMLVARFGTVLMTMNQLDVQIEGSAPYYSDAEWSDLAEKAAARIEGLTES